jgi:hypothetical protein
MGIGGLAQIVWRSCPRRIFLQIEMQISLSYATCRPYRVVGPESFTTLFMILPFGLVGLRLWHNFPDQPVRDPVAEC